MRITTDHETQPQCYTERCSRIDPWGKVYFGTRMPLVRDFHGQQPTVPKHLRSCIRTIRQDNMSATRNSVPDLDPVTADVATPPQPAEPHNLGSFEIQGALHPAGRNADPTTFSGFCGNCAALIRRQIHNARAKARDLRHSHPIAALLLISAAAFLIGAASGAWRHSRER